MVEFLNTLKEEMRNLKGGKQKKSRAWSGGACWPNIIEMSFYQLPSFQSVIFYQNKDEIS